MKKRFNVTGACNPNINYMVNIDNKLIQIKRMIDRGDYFTINRARQYGKTTTLGALERLLKKDYIVVHLDFQAISYVIFQSEATFSTVFAKELLRVLADDVRVQQNMIEQLSFFIEAKENNTLYELFILLNNWCAASRYPIVLMIDEVDTASNNQIFLDFLAQLRAGFIARQLKNTPTFLSVILAGVHDIKHLKARINVSSDGISNKQEKMEYDKTNSPWNIAADFRVDMSFDIEGIAGMLQEYEADNHTGMNVNEIAEVIYAYTSGYPYLVSRICNIIDEQGDDLQVKIEGNIPWTKAGVQEAVKSMLSEQNSLFDSLISKLRDYPEFRSKIFEQLFKGENIVYNPDSEVINMAQMFGFITNQNGQVTIANRIFEIRLYNYFLATNEAEQTPIYKLASEDKNQFVHHGKLNMKLVLERFVNCFTDLYGDQSDKFLEEEGRRYFLLFLRPIINGVGNYYIESHTRNAKRTDVIVDYRGEQFIIELKIWKGAAYNDRGEKQLSEYLEYYHLQKGYMVSFNFNKNKQVGVKEIQIGDKILVEAVV